MSDIPVNQYLNPEEVELHNLRADNARLRAALIEIRDREYIYPKHVARAALKEPRR